MVLGLEMVALREGVSLMTDLLYTKLCMSLKDSERV
jgi:hypothetical protein